MSAAGRGAVRRPLDAYYTPDDLADALVGVLPSVAGAEVLEPHAGGGAFVRALRSRGAIVTAIDISPSAAGLSDAPTAFCRDFLAFDGVPKWWPDWVVGNPPYHNAEAHVRHARAASQLHWRRDRLGSVRLVLVGPTPPGPDGA